MPGCICYNKSFLSTSLDKNRATSFIFQRNINEDEKGVLYIINKGDKLDIENASNLDI